MCLWLPLDEARVRNDLQSLGVRSRKVHWYENLVDSFFKLGFPTKSEASANIVNRGHPAGCSSRTVVVAIRIAAEINQE